MSLFDAHCHLQLFPLLDVTNEVVSRANLVGVNRLCVNATKEEDWEVVGQLAREHQSIVPSFGIHPWYTGELSTGWCERLKVLLELWPQAGVGETGLCGSGKGKMIPVEVQEEACMLQLRLAREMNRVVSLHCVQRHGRLLDMIKSVVKGGSEVTPWFLLHAYSGSRDMVMPFVKLGAMFSVGAAAANPRSHKLIAAVAAIPMDRLLLETDSPDQCPPSDLLPNLEPLILPIDQSQPPNEPANLPVIAVIVAKIKGVTVEEVIKVTTANANRFFKV